MASKFMDFSPSVATALKMGTPIVAIETGFFMRLPYPKNKSALEECEQAFWRRDCVPCLMGVVEGRLKAGLNKEDLDTLCQAGGSCTRSELGGLAADKGTAAAGAGATVAMARMAGIVPVMAPGLSDTLSDLDPLCSSARLVFCGRVDPDRALLYSSRSVAVVRSDDPGRIAEAYLLQRDLELTECTVAPCGSTLGEMAQASSRAALELKKRTDFSV